MLARVKQRKPEETGTESINKISFEVQIRTAFDPAWVVTTHALSYKSSVVDWKQQRLAAELKATAEKMDLLILAFQEASLKIEESRWPAIQAKKDIHSYFASAVETQKFPKELAPKDWSRFAENVYELGRHFIGTRKPEHVAGNLHSRA